MKTIPYSLNENPQKGPFVLTIGMFDGFHLGHQAIINRVVHLAKETGAKSAALTFENHPAEVLRPENRVCYLCSLEQKKSLFEKAGIDLLALAQFTREFSQQSAEDFLINVRSIIPFTHLVLGYDAAIGKNREGNKASVKALADELGFTVEYLEPLMIDGEPVSSTRIRQLLQKGHLKEVDRLLGRRFSIRRPVIKGLGLGKKLGFPTANMNVHSLCLPPLGIYAVTLFHEGKALPGAANLGYAPTVGAHDEPILEVHLIDSNPELYGKTVEVVFEAYIRPEKKFQNLDELTTQIAQDIAWTRNFFQNA